MEENQVIPETSPGLFFCPSTNAWRAKHRGVEASFSVGRYGEAARRLAERALLHMQAGTYDEAKDLQLMRMTFDIATASRMLNVHVSELRRWIITGLIRGKEVPPPMPDPVGGRNNRFCGHELLITRERLQGITW